MTHFTGLLQGIKVSTELSEFRKHLGSFNLVNLKARTLLMFFSISYVCRFIYLFIFLSWVFNLFLQVLVLNYNIQWDVGGCCFEHSRIYYFCLFS